MIGRLTGKLLSCSPGQVLIDVTGVGYDIHIPLSTFYTLSGGTGATVSLHVHTHVRAEALQLYGFASPEERTAFERLIAISGVGPRLALAILSGIGADELRAAVLCQDRARLQRIPGIGRKTAERLLLELRDKSLGDEDGSTGKEPGGKRPPESGTGVRADAVSALVNLGYSRDIAGRAVDGALVGEGASGSLEVVLRSALAGLIR